MRRISLLAVMWACATPAPQEDPDQWFTPPSDYDVTEAVAFTDENYDFSGPTAIADLPLPGDFELLLAPGDLPSSTDCADWVSSAELPAEIEGIVTLLPRYYYKTGGCAPTPDIDSDQKFYGSYFVQDETAGYFVLGDSKVAHFDMGDRVRLRVRAIKEAYDQTMIAVHDVVSIERGPEPIFFERADGPLTLDGVSRVFRIEGTVATPMSTFGEVYLDADDGTRYKFSLDAELARRGIEPAIGDRMRVTGPVLYSFSELTVLVMRVGQLEWLATAE
jgi:hypothetical protein